jgi:hypothetical protein
MTTRRRTTPPVPMSPIHRSSWRSLWRRCSCGLKEPCIDRLTTPELYLPAEQAPPPPSSPSRPQAQRHPDGAMVQGGIRAAVPPGAAGPHCGEADEYAAAVFLDRAARAPSAAKMRGPASAGFPVRQPGRAGSLTPAQSRRADQTRRRPDVPALREAVPGRACGSGPPQQSSPHHPARGISQLPARNRPGPGRNWSYDGRRVGDSTS